MNQADQAVEHSRTECHNSPVKISHPKRKGSSSIIFQGLYIIYVKLRGVYPKDPGGCVLSERDINPIQSYCGGMGVRVYQSYSIGRGMDS